MSRVVIPAGKKFLSYHLLKLVATYGENVLEDSVRQHVGELFPDYYVIPYKKDVETVDATETKRPDLAMIRRDFSGWGVIEVEVSNHGIDHVLEQVSVFTRGNYNSPEVARYIQRNILEHCQRDLPLTKIQKLIAEEAPKILVIVDEIKEEWRNQLNEIGVDLCAFELYKDTNGRHLYRSYGKYPLIPTREAHARRVPASANLLELTTSFKFKRIKKGKVVILFDNIATEWMELLDDGKQYLRFSGGANPLIMTDSYVIFSDKHERYYIRKN